jgi:hypothetical protein
VRYYDFDEICLGMIVSIPCVRLNVLIPSWGSKGLKRGDAGNAGFAQRSSK